MKSSRPQTRQWRPGYTLAAALLLGTSHLFVSLTAHAQGKQRAHSVAPKPLSQSLSGPSKADFEAAKLLATDGDFSGALIKFQNAYDTSKDPRLLWNIAFCHKNLRHYAKVISTLQRYVEDGDPILSAKDKQEALDLIALIEPFTTRASFEISESGASVYVDDDLVGSSPLSAPVVLDIGERRVRVTKEGFRVFEKALAIGGSSEITVDVALEKLVHEGKLIVNAPTNASIFLDNHQVATGKLEQAIVSGGHQIRITAPGMHPFQSEVVIKENETRSLDIVLEALAPAEKPKLRVAVGCTDPEPIAPEDGLVVYLDGPDVLAPTSVKRKWSDGKKGNVVEWVEFAVAPGRHQLRIGIPDCRALDAIVQVDAQKGAEIRGVLDSDRSILLRGPLGSPGWYRLALGLWLPAKQVRNQVPERYSGKLGDVVGASLEVGLVGRWFAAYVQGAMGQGSFGRDSHDTHYALPESASTRWNQLSLRLGPRFPFNIVALGFGIGLGMQELDLDQVRTGKKSGVASSYAELDLQPLCDWGLFAMATVDKAFKEDGVGGALHTGVYYQPSSRCRRERTTQIGLTAR
jgi:hypothetical protein